MTHRDLAHFGWLPLAALVVALGAATSCSERPMPQPVPEVSKSSAEDQPPGPAWFEDRTSNSGLEFTYRNGEEAERFTILESLGGGVGLLDYDADGRLDVFVTGGGAFAGPDREKIEGRTCRLFRNLGDFRFEDVTARVGLEAVAWWYTHGVAVADYDRDGWPDFAVTGYGRIGLFHNEPDGRGGRRFAEVAQSVGLIDPLWSTSAAWGDLDGDGFPDLYVAHYCDWSFTNDPACTGAVTGNPRDVCPPQKFRPLVHALFRNEGGTSFRNVAADHRFEPAGYGLGVVFADVNADARPDLYVANDASPNFLYLNRGGKLEEAGLVTGVAADDSGHANGSMGVDAADYDGSGRASLWTTNFQVELHALYQNLGNGRFQHVSRAAGIGALGMNFVGFGTAFVDCDFDGWEDLVIAHGHVSYKPFLSSSHKQRPVLLHNEEFRGRRFFRDIGRDAGDYFRTPAVGRGLAVGDLDNDGWPDLVVSHSNSPVTLLRNVVARHAPAKWIRYRLIGAGNRDVVGSTISLEVEGRTRTRFIKGGGSYLSASDPRVVFGLGPSGAPGRVSVSWSWGKMQSWDGLEAGSEWELREGDPTPRRAPR